MAHQCLKCGQTYPDGSPQILKGCEGCKGTRFFYTEAPIGAAKREELAASADEDLERLALGKESPRSSRRIPTKGELPMGTEADWIKLGPGYLRNLVEDVVKRSQTKKPVFRTGGEPPKALVDWVREQGGEVDEPEDLAERHLHDDRSEDERLEVTDLFADSPEDEPETAPPATVEEGPVEVPEEVVYQRGPRKVPEPIAIDGHSIDEDEQLKAEARRRLEEVRAELEKPPERPPAEAAPEAPTLYPEGTPPETVAIRGEGEYELDVKRLLEKSPIVVHKDGTYSLHLPSLMETVGRKRR
ncbi:MAG: hypothetical protein KY455_13540 [Euryarchaeota archaeon]|nr:hypothetical protein [Euryarchaeota archaeon]